MNLDGFKYVFNDESLDLMVNKDGIFYDTKYMRLRSNNTLVGRGYNKVSIKGNYFLVHRVVIQTFLPIENSELYDVHHKDGNKNNNNLNNLEYIKKDNHSSYHNSGVKNGRATITEEIAKYIKYDTKDKSYYDTVKLLKNKFNVEPSKHIVSKIRTNKTWKSI